MTITTLNNDTTTLLGVDGVEKVATCAGGTEVTYNSSIGFTLSMPEYEAIGTALLLTLITLITIVGNVLVILSVFTYKPLRIVQNFFIVSLAVADLTVAILVLPLNVAYYIRGRWDFGIHVCKMWLTSDVMCCTASILHLCVIALDRYWAITDPINYAQKRNVERVLFLIAGVWILSFVISSPPLLGWNDWPSDFHSNTPCELTSEPGYVIYSSLGSFFLPLLIMTIVYIEIFVATRRRLRERAQAATKMNALTMKSQVSAAVATRATVVATQAEPTTQQQNNSGGSGETRGERESISSEVNHNETSAMMTPEEQRQNRKSKLVDSSKALLRKFQFAKRKKRKTAKHDVDEDDEEEDEVEVHHGKKKNRELIVADENSANDAQEHDDDDVNDSNHHQQLNSDTSNKAIVSEAATAAEGAAANGNGNENGISTTQQQKQDDSKHQKSMTNSSSSVIEIDKRTKLAMKKSASNKNIGSSQNNGPPKKTGGVYQFIEEKQKISLTRERRAARTLGIIMGECESRKSDKIDEKKFFCQLTDDDDVLSVVCRFCEIVILFAVLHRKLLLVLKNCAMNCSLQLKKLHLPYIHFRMS